MSGPLRLPSLGDPFKQHVAERLQSLRALIATPPKIDEQQSLLDTNDSWHKEMETKRGERDAELDQVF